MLCFRKDLVAKNETKTSGEYRSFPSKIFCLTVSKNIVEQPFRVSLISSIENVCASEGMSRFSGDIFCLTVPKHFVEESFCPVFQKSSGSEKVYVLEGVTGEYRNCPSKNFRLALPKEAVGEALSLSFVSDIEKNVSEGYFTILC